MEKQKKLKIGCNNILIILLYSVILSYGNMLQTAIWNNISRLLNGDINWRYILSLYFSFAGMYVLICYGLILKIVYILILKFKIIFVSNNKLTAIYVFRFGRKTIILDEIQSVEWETWKISPFSFISVNISDHNNTITMSDFEFENFRGVVFGILKKKYAEDSIHYFKDQAKQNSLLTYFILSASIILLLFTFEGIDSNNLSNFRLLVLIVSILIIVASIKRIYEYRKVTKIYNSKYLTK